MHTTISLTATIFSVLLLSACDVTSTVDSDKVASKDIYAYFDVTHAGQKDLYIEARLTTDIAKSTAYVNLVEDDKLISVLTDSSLLEPITDNIFQNLARVSKVTHTLDKGQVRTYDLLFGASYAVDGLWYFTSYADVSTDATVNIEFDRAVSNTTLRSQATLPPSFEITAPSSQDIYSRSGDLTVTWSPASVDHLMTIDATANCVNNQIASWTKSYATGDPGFVTIPATQWTGLNGECSIRVLLERVKLGQLDKGFKGGRIAGRQQRAVSLTSIE